MEFAELLAGDFAVICRAFRPTTHVNDAPSRQLRILVVDDEEFIRAAIKLCLKSDGHSVEEASSGEEALTIFQQGPFDLVLTDQSMTGITGAELALAIKQQARSCPVVMVTAYALILPPTLPGVDVILAKPFEREELREAIRKVC